MDQPDRPSDAALRALVDREAIRDLVHGYCRAVDRKDVAAVRALYHPDATDDHGAYYQGSAQGYCDALPDLMAPVAMMQHHITTMNIRIDGDRAESETYGLAIHRMDGPDGDSDLIVGTRFLDRFARRDGRWKILHRSHALDWTSRISPSRSIIDDAMFAASPRGRGDAGDPSYTALRLFPRGAAPGDAIGGEAACPAA